MIQSVQRRQSPSAELNSKQEKAIRNSSIARVLIVDDFEPWRNFVISILREELSLEIVGVASDGAEAVHKAKELQPDLILLDIGLPKLNGIEAARHIHAVAPKSKILFLSQESAADLGLDALNLGAWGYVAKAQAGTELIAAVKDIIQGKQFFSRGLEGHDIIGMKDAPASEHSHRDRAIEAVAPLLLQKKEMERRHEVQFYSENDILLDSFTRFIGANLRAGNSVIVLVTKSHEEALVYKIRADGIDLDSAHKQGRYISLDPAETLSRFMVNDLPDPVRFMEALDGFISTAAKAATGEQGRVAICGECASLMWLEGKADAAIRLEQLLDQIAKIYGVDILCAYPLDSFCREEDSHIFRKISAEHSVVHSR